MPTFPDYARFLPSLGSTKFRTLWDAQSYVLREYVARFSDKPDVAIELPTGAGKTLIALLVAEIWRRSNSKVAILSANKTLARQMLREAEELRIPAVLMEGSGIDIPSSDRRAYQRATGVAIMNYWVYFNQNPIIDPADLLIMDDAHLAEHCLHSLYSVEVDRLRHESLFKSLVTELRERFPEYSVLTEALQEGSPSDQPPELLSFVDQDIATERIREIIDASPVISLDTDFRFRWARTRNVLREANIYLGASSIWFRPYVYPLISNLHYEQSRQRIYLSATIGDPGDLGRRLGARGIVKIPIPPEFSEKTFGRRLIVMNRIEDENFPPRVQGAVLAALRILPKSLWLCSSHRDAVNYRQVVSEWLNSNGLVGHPTWVLTPLGDEIEQFKASPRGHLFVAGRFDGMDFRADECRLVIVTTLPRAINLQEEFISAYLRDSGFMKRRLNQRVIQALGRCNRAEDDFGVYVLADRRFATHFGRESNRGGIPRNIVAEIDMAQDLAENTADALVHSVQQFLNRDFATYDRSIQTYLAQVPIEPSLENDPDTSSDEVLGWTAMFASQNYRIAADRFEQCWDAAISANRLEVGALHGWHWAKALYLQSRLGEPSARDRSVRVLEDAINRGGRSSWFNRMRASLNRARTSRPMVETINAEYSAVLLRAFDDHLERLSVRGSGFARWCDALSSNLNSGRHSEFLLGLEQLGQILGYTASRPRYGSAPDCRWRGIFGNLRELITIEAKIEDTESQMIVAEDVGQAHNQLARAESEFAALGYTIRSAIVTHLPSLSPEAEASAGPIKIVSKEALRGLWERVRILLSLYRDNWSLNDIRARSAAASSIMPRVPHTGWLIRALDADRRNITSEILLVGWS